MLRIKVRFGNSQVRDKVRSDVSEGNGNRSTHAVPYHMRVRELQMLQDARNDLGLALDIKLIGIIRITRKPDRCVSQGTLRHFASGAAVSEPRKIDKDRS